MRNTDRDWKGIGDKEPYWGVVTFDQYRRRNMNDKALTEFYLSGAIKVEQFLSTFKHYFGDDFKPKNVLDFGCGCGRLLLPLAKTIDCVTGVDISPGMLKKAANRIQKLDLKNIELLEVLPDKKFDWINSYIVFQHIPPQRGLKLIKVLLKHLEPGGFISLHITTHHKENSESDPYEEDVDDGVCQMRMYNYDLNEVLASFYNAGILDPNMKLTNHNGHVGSILYGRKHI